VLPAKGRVADRADPEADPGVLGLLLANLPAWVAVPMVPRLDPESLGAAEALLPPRGLVLEVPGVPTCRRAVELRAYRGEPLTADPTRLLFLKILRHTRKCSAVEEAYVGVSNVRLGRYIHV
jgi:hypothetical protein